MKLYELLKNIDFEMESQVEDYEINKITHIPDSADEKTLLVCLKRASDGKAPYDLINESAAPLVVCEQSDAQYITLPKITVESSRIALSYLYSHYYAIEYDKTKFIAITGTNGKTTTAWMLYKILAYAGRRVGFIGTGKIEYMGEILSEKHYTMTTPDPKLLYKSIKEMQERGAKYIVMEVSSHAIALGKVAPIPFEIGIFTNLSREHLDFHSDMENYYQTKLKLFDNVKYGIFNEDDEYSRRAMTEVGSKCTARSIGIIWPAPIVARDIILDGFNGSSYFYKDESRIFKVSLAPVGYYNVYNSMMALAAAILLKIPSHIARESISKIKSVDGRFEILRSDIYAIIDYAHTPQAFENVLKTVNSVKKTWQNIITVFGCGGERDALKRPLMGEIAEKYSNRVYITEDNSRGEPTSKIISDIIGGMSYPEKRSVITSRSEAISHAIASASTDDIVLILGKGHEKYIITDGEISDFSEREIIERAFEKRKCGGI